MWALEGQWKRWRWSEKSRVLSLTYTSLFNVCRATRAEGNETADFSDETAKAPF